MYVLPTLQEKCISLTLDLQTGAYSLKGNIYTARACCIRQNAHATSLYGYDGFMKHVANSLKHVAWTHHTCTLKFHVSHNKVVWPFSHTQILVAQMQVWQVTEPY